MWAKIVWNWWPSKSAVRLITRRLFIMQFIFCPFSIFLSHSLIYHPFAVALCPFFLIFSHSGHFFHLILYLLQFFASAHQWHKNANSFRNSFLCGQYQRQLQQKHTHKHKLTHKNNSKWNDIFNNEYEMVIINQNHPSAFNRSI